MQLRLMGACYPEIAVLVRDLAVLAGTETVFLAING